MASCFRCKKPKDGLRQCPVCKKEVCPGCRNPERRCRVHGW